MASVLVVDDEPRIARLVQRCLLDGGIRTRTETDPVLAARRVLTEHHDLILLDLLMPELNGVALLRRIIGARPDQRVMILSCAACVDSRVRCLELGAVDFLAKPFSPAELTARVRVHLRSASTDLGAVRRSGRIELDLARRTVDAGWGPVKLSARELDVMQALIDHQDEICPRSELMESVWGEAFPDPNTLEACVRRLRRKLGRHVIETVRSRGYRLVTS